MPQDDLRTVMASMLPEAIVSALADQSVVSQTPCGSGTVVWRRWGKGPPLLLLHGSHGSWMHWIRNITHLSKTRTIWVPDIPGFGQSSLPGTATLIGDIAAALANGLKALGVGAPLAVAGFSFGGTVAAHLAAVTPELVGRIILVDSGGLGTPMAPLHMVRVRRDAPDMEAHRHNLQAMMIHEIARVDALALYIQAMNIPLARIDVRDMVLPDRLARALEAVDVPVDAIWGEFDQPHPHPASQWDALRKVRPAARMRIVAAAGHWSIYENAAAFNTHLDELLGPSS